MRKMSFWILLPVFFNCGCLAMTGFAQSNGTVRGIVKDSSGAVLPGANVTLTHKATSKVIETLTTESGTYAFTFLAPGEYMLSFDMAGFKRLVRDKVIVNIAEAVAIDVQLEVGDVTQEISVTAEAALVQTTETTLGRVVEEKMLTEVPLSSRNMTQILALSPGVTSDVPDAGAFGRNSVNISANGGRPFDNSVTVNGLLADNIMSLGFEDRNDKTGIPVPSPDAIQEFKVQTGLYDAETGRQGGANIQVVTKSGTNQIHGGLFEFFRNDALNANEFFRNRSGEKRAVLRQNQFGGNLGGPIIKDKMFFFGLYQGTRQINGVASDSAKNTFLPTLGSDRSARALGALYGGQRGVFGGVAVAPGGSNINPIALNILNAKLPNGEFAIPSPQIILPSGTGFSAFSQPNKFNEDQFVANWDYNHSEKNRYGGRVFFSTFPSTVRYSGSTNIPGWGENLEKSNLSTVLSHVHMFSPSTLNNLRLGYSRNFMEQQTIEPLKAAQLGIKPAVREYEGAPAISVTGLFSFGPQSDTDNLTIIHGYEVADTLSRIKGRHELRVGGSANPYRITRRDVFFKRGSLTFRSFPDFLLGMSGAQNGTAFSNISAANAANGISRRDPRFKNFALFVQDDFRANSQLTLNLGLRYQFNSNQQDHGGRNGGFDRRLALKGFPPPEGTFAGMIIPSNADVAVPPGFTKLDRKTLVERENWLGFAPRAGLAFRPVANWNTFVVRAGYGVFWTAIAGTVTEQAFFDPWYVWYTAGGAAASNATFENPWVIPVPPSEAFPAFVPYNLGTNRTTLSIDPEMKQPYTQNWSLNLQYGVRDYMFEVAYVGSKATHVLGRGKPNQALLASPERPINGQTTNTVENAVLRVPIIGFTASGFSEVASLHDSQYHSLQLTAKKRYANGLSFMTAYTWGHGIDDVDHFGGRNSPMGTSVGDYYNRRSARGTSNFDRTHRLVASYLWELPRLRTDNALITGVLNGWSISGVTTIQSGLPFTINDQTAGTIYGSPGTNNAQFAPGKAAHDARLTGSVKDRLSRFFDTSVFVPPPIIGNGTGFGNSGRNILRGPGQANFDLALGKNFGLARASEGHTLEFRSEFFNLFNHAQFGNPGTTRGTAAFAVISQTVVAPRIVQFALKYRF